MKRTVLVTGGAGFIGSHVTDELIAAGYHVRVLDNLSLVAPSGGQRAPAFLNRDAELIIGDIQDPETVRRALKGVEAVCHLASAVGTSQSMLDIRSYMLTNAVGTAVLIDGLIEHPVERLVVASSMNVYGEGAYETANGLPVSVEERALDHVRSADWDLRDRDGQALIPVATPETKPPALNSVYALSKFSQEKLCLMVGKEYGIPTVALRIFNAYGPRQFLLNRYAGVLSVFASRLMNQNPPVIYEDGNQLRDFVHVNDVARAFRLALTSNDAAGQAVNVGSGAAVTVLEAAALLAHTMGREHVKLRITGRHRMHDVRHCFADIRLAHQLLNFDPIVTFTEGIAEMANWLLDRVPYDRTRLSGLEMVS